MVRRTGQWERQQAENRRQRAAGWRRARERLFAHPTGERLAIRALWRACPYPADPSYLGTLLHEIATGRIDPAHPPWGGRHTLTPRTTPKPASFTEAFRQIGRRTVGGGPKTTGADERLFCGNLGSGILFLTSRVRLCEPNESFYTSSNHRLRDSHVGRGGHWVDIVVRGTCSDAELILIRRLAQREDTRPVRVRRSLGSARESERECLRGEDRAASREPDHGACRKLGIGPQNGLLGLAFTLCSRREVRSSRRAAGSAPAPSTPLRTRSPCVARAWPRSPGSCAGPC
jgi:hypothetical protein